MSKSSVLAFVCVPRDLVFFFVCDGVTTTMSETSMNDTVVFGDNDDHHDDINNRDVTKVRTRVTEDNSRINNMPYGEVNDDEAKSVKESSITSAISTGLVPGVRQWALAYDAMCTKALEYTDRRRRRLSGEVLDSSEWSASSSNVHPVVASPSASTSTTSSWTRNENSRKENEEQSQKSSPHDDQHSNDRPIDFSLRTTKTVVSVADTPVSDNTPNESELSVFDGRVDSNIECRSLARQCQAHDTVLRYHNCPNSVDNTLFAQKRQECSQRRDRWPIESLKTARKDWIHENRIHKQETRRRKYVDAIRQAQITMDLKNRCTLNKAMSMRMALEYKFLKNVEIPNYLRNYVDQEGFWIWRDDIIPLVHRSDGSIQPNELDLIIREVESSDTESSDESETNAAGISYSLRSLSPDSRRECSTLKMQNHRVRSVMQWWHRQPIISSPLSGNHEGDKDNNRPENEDHDYEEGSETDQERSVFLNASQDVDVDWSTIGQNSSDSTDFEAHQRNMDAINSVTSDSSLGDPNEIEAMENIPTKVVEATSKKGDRKRRTSVVAIVEPLRPFSDVENAGNDVRTSHRDQEQVDVPRSFTATAKALSLAHIELFQGVKRMTNAIRRTMVAPNGSTEAAETTTSLVVPINPEITTRQHTLLDDLKQILDSILKLMKNSGAANAETSTSRISNYVEETVFSAERIAEEIVMSDLPQATTVDYATVIKTYQELMRRIDNINDSIQQFIRLLREETDWLVDTYEWAGEVALIGDRVTALLQNLMMDGISENQHTPSPSLVPSLSPAQDVQENRRRYQERRIRLRQYREQNRLQQQRQPTNRPSRLLESFMSNLPDRVFPHRPVEMLLNGHVTRGSYFETNQMSVTILEDGHILIIDSCMENATELRRPSSQNLPNSVPTNLVGPISTASTLAVPITVTENSNSVPMSPAVMSTYTSSTTSTTLNFTATDSSYSTTTSSEFINTSPIYTSPTSVTNITMVNGAASTTNPQNSAQTYNRTHINDFRQWPTVSESLLNRSELEPSPPPITTADWIASPMARVATVAANIATQRLRQRTNSVRFLRRPSPPVIVVTPATDDEEEGAGAVQDEQELEFGRREGDRSWNGVTRRRFRSLSPPFNGARASYTRWRFRSRAAGRRRRQRRLQHGSPSDGSCSAMLDDNVTTKTPSSSSQPSPPSSPPMPSSSLLPPPPAPLSPPPVALRSALPSRPTTGVPASAPCQCVDIGYPDWSSCTDFTANDQPSPEHNHQRNTTTAAAADLASDHATAATAAPSRSNVSYGAGGSSGRTYTTKRSQSNTNTSPVPTRKFKFAFPVRDHNSDQLQ